MRRRFRDLEGWKGKEKLEGKVTWEKLKPTRGSVLDALPPPSRTHLPAGHLVCRWRKWSQDALTGSGHRAVLCSSGRTPCAGPKECPVWPGRPGSGVEH